MRKAATERIRINSLAELDALVGKYLTGEMPRTHWEDSQTDFQFDTVEEAVEALHDPYFRQFVARTEPVPAVLTEVKEFRPYSSDLTAAWDVVEKLSRRLEPLLVRREGTRWIAAFGKSEAVSAGSAAVAICLAALRARDLNFDCDVEALEQGTKEDPALADAQIKSFYSRP